MTSSSTRRERIDFEGAHVSAVVAGSRGDPTILLIHGFPSASHTFETVIPRLSESCFVIAPDLPGFGRSDVIAQPTFDRFADAMERLLKKLEIDCVHLYVHDYGAPVALELAMRDPTRVLGLIIQNANAHRTGFGPQWRDTIHHWETRTKESERAATAHLTSDGVRDQYVGGIPQDIVARISPEKWIEDWRIMSQPGRLELNRALVGDYGNYVGRFERIAAYLRKHQPPALMLWGRHDIFFDPAEILSWLQDLPRMEAHILDGPHLLLETHADTCAELIVDFVESVARRR